VTAALATVIACSVGVAYAAGRPVPENVPGVAVQNTTGGQLPGNTAALEAALSATGPVKYKILVVDSTEGEDLTAYLDRVAAEWGVPGPDTLYLILYAGDNFNIRFYMGANFRTAGVDVDEMLSLVRTHYLAGKRGGDVAGALADLIGAVNQRMDGWAAAGSFTVPSPFAPGGRRTAVQQLDLANALLSRYFADTTLPALPDEERLIDYRWDVGEIHVLRDEEALILYAVSFDVQPAAGADSVWAERGGEAGDDGWINGIRWYLTAVQEGDSWRIEGFSPNSDGLSTDR